MPPASYPHRHRVEDGSVHTVRRLLVGLLLTAAHATTTTAAEKADTKVDTSGWTLMHLDLSVVLEPEHKTFRTSGTMTLRCDSDSSNGPVLVMNGRDHVLEFVAIEGPNIVHTVLNELDPEDAALRLARIELSEPTGHGEVIELSFRCKGEGTGFQIGVDAELAIASWTDGWYPFPQDDGERSLSQRMSVAGTTTIQMPSPWKALTEGRLEDRFEDGDVAIERWTLNTAMARSFAAGPYEVARHQFGEREVGVYLLTASATSAQQQAETLAQAIGAMEERFGPFPYPSYAIAEVPAGRYQWYAASQQGLIFASSHAFRGDEGNLPLFAHESAHAWWGNLVGTTGPGGILCSESLAQYGAVVALESVRGEDAATQFMRFSAPGYSSYQCAKGYFQIVAMGEDRPMSALESGGMQHHLSDAKGHWVYHMLRRRVGDQTFFATLRTLIGEYQGRRLSLRDVREAFVEAADPAAELEVFFEQWLDRTGAPDLEIEWAHQEDPSVVKGVIRQVQPGAPYHLMVEIALASQSTPAAATHLVEIRERETAFAIPVDSTVARLVIDPYHRLLIWKPEYGPRPVKRPGATQEPADAGSSERHD